MQKRRLKIKEVVPPHTMILVTADTYSESECISDTGMIENDLVGTLKEVQTVLAVGPSVKDIKVGDLVYLDFRKYERRKFSKDDTKSDMPDEYENPIISYEIPMFEVNDSPCLLVDSYNVFFKITDFDMECYDVDIPSTTKKVLVS